MDLLTFFFCNCATSFLSLNCLLDEFMKRYKFRITQGRIKHSNMRYFGKFKIYFKQLPTVSYCCSIIAQQQLRPSDGEIIYAYIYSEFQEKMWLLWQLPHYTHAVLGID